MSNFDLVLSYALSVTAAAKTSMKAYLQVEKETRGGYYLVLSFRALFPILTALICKFRLYSIKTVEEVGAWKSCEAIFKRLPHLTTHIS